MPIDHLVYAGPDLDVAAALASSLLGVESHAGGQHVGRGTRNRLVDLGSGTYLEIIGPDVDQPEPIEPRPFGIDELKGPRLVAWAAGVDDIDAADAALARAGARSGAVESMQRRTDDGALLQWRLTPPRSGVMPFLIEWGATVHPTASLPQGPTLLELRIETATPGLVRRVLRTLRIDADVAEASSDRLAARILVGGTTVVLE